MRASSLVFFGGYSLIITALHRTNTFNLLFSRLSSHWPLLFPSTRATAALPFGAGQYLNGGAMGNAQQRPELDFEDESVWSFLAALAVNCDMAQQQTLVVQVRDKVMECISSKKWAAPEVAALKIVRPPYRSSYASQGLRWLTSAHSLRAEKRQPYVARPRFGSVAT